jgi:hypothetical protein
MQSHLPVNSGNSDTTERLAMATKSHPSSAFAAGMMLAALLSACGKSEEPTVPDAERIQMVAQAVLAASDRKAAQGKRDEAHKAWGEVTQTLTSFKASLLTGSTATTQDNPKQREQAIKQILAALDSARRQIDRASSGRSPEREVLSAQGLRRSVLAKIDSLRGEIETWQGKSAAEQLRAVTRMLARIEIRPAYAPQRDGETPTVSTLTEHR